MNSLSPKVYLIINADNTVGSAYKSERECVRNYTCQDTNNSCVVEVNDDLSYKTIMGHHDAILKEETIKYIVNIFLNHHHQNPVDAILHDCEPFTDEDTLRDALTFNHFMAVVQDNKVLFFRLYHGLIDKGEIPADVSWMKTLGAGELVFKNHKFVFYKDGSSSYNGAAAKIFCDKTVSKIVQRTNPELYSLGMY